MPPRTKACAICRKKRIKCDLTLPQCLMCIRTGKSCPGPLDGPLIIDMSKPKQPRRTKACPNNSTQNITLYRDSPDIPQGTTFLGQLLYAIPLQVDHSSLVTQAFFAHFLTYFTSTGESADLQNQKTWMHHLPHLSTQPSEPALSLALAATATAFCGSGKTGQDRNPAILQYALRLYGQALQAQSKSLRRRPKLPDLLPPSTMDESPPAAPIAQETPDPYTIETVSTSILLSLFEAMQSTTPTAYRAHIHGAVRIMEHTGPNQCHQGVMCQLFFHIRTQMAFVNLTTGSTAPMVQVRRILLRNLEYRRLPVFQQLLDYIAILAEVYVARDQGEQEQERRRGDAEAEERTEVALFQFVESEISRLYTEFTALAEAQGEALIYNPSPASQPIYRDSYTALTLSYFCAANILLSVLASRLDVASSIPSAVSRLCGKEVLLDDYAMILDAARFLGAERIGCAYMRTATPLFLVAKHSPDASQRKEAVSIFEAWEKGSMRGISALALGGLGEVGKRVDGDHGVESVGEVGSGLREIAV